MSDGYDAGFDCEWYDAVPAPAMPYPAPVPAPVPAPAPAAPMEFPAPVRPSWMARHRRWVLLVGGGILFPALLMALGALLAWVLRRELLWPEQLAHLGHNPWLLLLALPVALLSVGGLHLLTKLVPGMERALKETGATDHRDTIRLLGYPGILLLVVTSGFGEEVLFRGGLQPTVTIPVAALLFGLAHGGWEKRMWAYVVAATLAGCLYGLVYALTGMLWVSMLAHGLHNVLSVVLAGKKIDLEWEGGWPRFRVTPEE